MENEELKRVRRQFLRVAEHWLAQRDIVAGKELLFRLRTAPIHPTDPGWDPVEGAIRDRNRERDQRE